MSGHPGGSPLEGPWRVGCASQPARARAALEEHRNVLAALAALAAGDADEATRLLRAHLMASLENAVSLLAPES